jgi:hypothetical protein
LALDSKTCGRIVISPACLFMSKAGKSVAAQLVSIRFLIDEAIRRRPEFFVQTQTPVFAAPIRHLM